MPLRVVWTAQAREDLQAIKAFIARDAPATATAFIRGIRNSVGQLRGFPESGGVVAEVGEPNIRELIHGNYRVIYRVANDRVEILTVFHGSKILDRSDLPDDTK